jgi:hypothetical protein
MQSALLGSKFLENSVERRGLEQDPDPQRNAFESLGKSVKCPFLLFFYVC